MDEKKIREVFATWMEDYMHAHVTRFFRENPGVIETVEGLALRMGVDQNALRECIQDHVKLGLLRERRIGDRVLLIYDKERQKAMERLITESLQLRMEDAP